uniref:Uncharacterized protein n=1 Tax=Globodera rostochiensis TaxID=31243 RepID=A0A914I676_GLORO
MHWGTAYFHGKGRINYQICRLICASPLFWSPTEHSTNSEFAFVHIFFINSANFDEYRLSVRPEISECAKVSKDKKAKNLLMDKLKSDFSRFQNRIFEFVDLSNEKAFAAFTIFFQSTLFTSFEIYIANLNANALKLRGSVKDTSFGPPHLLINEQFRISRFYWNLGLFDFALTELDTLAKLLSDSIRVLSKNAEMSSPQWLKHLRLLPLDRHCTLLGVQMYLNVVGEELSLVKIHAHLLAHQFMLSAQSLQNRLSLATAPSGSSSPPPLRQSHSQPSTPSLMPKMDDKALEEGEKRKQEQNQQQLNTLQLRHNTVTSVLRYAQDAIHRFEEDILVLRANHNETLFHCLILVWLAELFKYSEHLLGNSASKLYDVTSAIVHVNFLLHKKCEAIRHLCSTIFGNDKTDKSTRKQCLTMLRRWLDSTPLNVPSLDGTKYSSLGGSTNELQQRQQSALADESARLFRTFSEMICEAIDGDKGANAFKHFAKFSLTEALESFERFGWHRNDFFVRQQLAELIIDSAPHEAHAHFCQNLRALLSRQSLLRSLAQHNLNTLEALVEHFEKTAVEGDAETRKILFGCSLVVLSLLDRVEGDEPIVERWHSRLARENEAAQGEGAGTLSANLLTWPCVKSELPFLASANKKSIGFPLGLVRVSFVSSPLIRRSSICSPLSLIVELQNSLAVPLIDCVVKARFKSYSKENYSPNSTLASFIVIGPNEKGPGGPFSLERLPAKSVKLSPTAANEFFELCQIASDNCVTFGAKSTANCTLTSEKIEKSGYFFLDSVLEEMAKNAKLEHIVCFIVAIQPNIQMKWGNVKKEESAADVDVYQFVSGMEQRFILEVSPGTAPLEAPSQLQLFMGQCPKNSIKFLDAEGNWAPNAQFSIPPLDAETNHRIFVRIYKEIDRLDDGKEKGGQIVDKFEIKAEWFRKSVDELSERVLVVQQTFPITFCPIMLLSWHTSFLVDRTLFHLDICRKGTGDGGGIFLSDVAAVNVLPTAVVLSQENNISLEQVAAELLNPGPLKPIVPNSIFRFIWRLPGESPEDKSVAVPHFLELKYRILAKNWHEKDDDANAQQRVEDEREHSLKHQIDVPLQKIGRCFIGLANPPILCIESDGNAGGHFWHCAERHKLARVKESGVGQAIFTMVPKQLGFLPFPSITLHRPNGFDHSPSRNSSSLNEKRFGERLLVFYRNQASQIHILGPLHGASDETASISSANTTESTEQKKKSLKTVAKDRLQKLFE